MALIVVLTDQSQFHAWLAVVFLLNDLLYAVQHGQGLPWVLFTFRYTSNTFIWEGLIQMAPSDEKQQQLYFLDVAPPLPTINEGCSQLIYCEVHLHAQFPLNHDSTVQSLQCCSVLSWGSNSFPNQQQ